MGAVDVLFVSIITSISSNSGIKGLKYKQHDFKKNTWPENVPYLTLL